MRKGSEFERWVGDGWEEGGGGKGGAIEVSLNDSRCPSLFLFSEFF